ncbi:MAG: glycosyltransferase family 4 protein [Actinomycetia bacterium]|nr:glycosyltransferase family 4 protein [Actinomycetes bacterium]
MVLETSKRKALTKISIISYDIVGKKMAGPGIRFFEFSKILSKFADITLHTPNKVDIEIEGVKVKHYNAKNYSSLQRSLEKAEVILIQGHILYYFPLLKNFPGKIIVDLYNPFNLESLEMFREKNIAERLRIDKNNNDIIKLQLAVGDFFICASEKQRDYWIGMLSALGRINPYSYDADNTLRNLIDVVPFGIPSDPPKRVGTSISDIIPNIREGDKILLWGGGIWNWLDPITTIKALWETARNRNDLKLLFMGIKHPDPKLPEMKKCLDAIKLSKELNLYNDKVFFNEWTPYDMRQAMLLESDAGLSIHQERIETEFSYRTRVLDYIWAGLPVIATEGDSIAKMVKEEDIGEVVKYEDTTQLARVMASILSNKSLQDIYKKNIKKIRTRFYWENVTKPLVKYCRNPSYAVDKKKIHELVKFQNNRLGRIIKEKFEGSTNVLLITKNRLADKNIIANGDVGKIFYLEAGDPKGQDGDLDKLDKIGTIKSRINQRTKFDGIIIMNAFTEITPRFFHDLVSVLGRKLKKGGLLFMSLPENRGLAELLRQGETRKEIDIWIDDFAIEHLFKNSGFKVLDKGTRDTVESIEDITGDKELGQVYGKNELFELFEIGLDRSKFEDLDLLSRFKLLESEEFAPDKSVRGKIKKYVYLLSSMYFENMRKSYNQSMMNLSNNIQIQINNEINELNRKNRERMLLIYFNIFRTLYHEIKSLGSDIKSLKSLLDELQIKKKSNAEGDSIEQRLEILLRDLENIDRILGLSVTNRYYLAKKK